MSTREYSVLHVDLFVRSMDTALEFYCDKLGFFVVDDSVLSGPIVRNLSNGLYEKARVVLLRVSAYGAMIELQEFKTDGAPATECRSAPARTGWMSIMVSDLTSHIEDL